MSLENTVEDLIQKSYTNIPQNEGDYIGENGLLYCGKCNTPKQVEIECFGKTRRPMCLCKCATEKRDAEEREEKRRKFEERVKDLRRTGFPKGDMQNWTFANDDMANEKITKAMKNYVTHFAELKKQGKGLLLYGTVGTGKTFAACEVANALIDKGYPVLVTNFARMINQIQGTFEKQEYIDSLNNFSLLIIDDLSAERDTSFANEQVFQIIDARYRANLPMIITTNLSMETLKRPESINQQRVYERILERCFPIKVTGENKRRNKIREEYRNMQELLGLD